MLTGRQMGLKDFDIIVKDLFWWVHHSQADVAGLLLPAALAYRVQEPYTAFLCFDRDDGQGVIVWEISRDELARSRSPLTAGLCSSADVKIYPSPTDEDRIEVELTGRNLTPTGPPLVVSTFAIPVGVLDFYLGSIYNLVPSGHESQLMEPTLNQAISQILDLGNG